MRIPRLLGAARHSINYVPRLARKMPLFRNVYDHEDILGRPIAPVLAVSTGNAPTDEVHFCLPIWIVTGANGDVLVPVTRLIYPRIRTHSRQKPRPVSRGPGAGGCDRTIDHRATMQPEIG